MDKDIAVLMRDIITNNIIADILYLKNPEFEYPDMPTGEIELGISPDNRIYYHSLHADSELKDGVFTITGYYGKILVPRHAGIQINLNINITGVIASPTNIENRGNINLDVLKDSHLELCLMGQGNLMINGEIKHSSDDYIYSYGQNFDKFTQAYSVLPPYMQKKDIMYNMNVCLHYNLLNICNDGQNITLRYHGADKKGIRDELKHDKNVTIIRLRREMEHAVSIEDYIKAASIQKELDNELKELNNESFNGKMIVEIPESKPGMKRFEQ